MILTIQGHKQLSRFLVRGTSVLILFAFSSICQKVVHVQDPITLCTSLYIHDKYYTYWDNHYIPKVKRLLFNIFILWIFALLFIVTVFSIL